MATDAEVEEYAESQRVERDVVFFFHQQADYGSVMDDLDYTFFQEKYWEVLLRDREMTPEIQSGCLALLFAMGSYESGNIGRALGPALPECLNALRKFVPSTDQIGKLKEATILALSIAAVPQEHRDWNLVEKLAYEGEWIHELVIRPYFRSRTLRFDTERPG